MAGSAVVLTAYLGKGGGHGEGSRGGHIIGHTRAGHPIYAHGSVKAEHVRPLIEGHKYGVEHMIHGRPDPDEEHLEEHIYSMPGFSARGDNGTVPLANGHHLAFTTNILSHETPGRRVYVEPNNPLSYYEDGEPAEIETNHAIVDANGKKVEGAELTDELKELADNTDEQLTQRAEEDYRPEDHYDDGADDYYDRWKDER